MTRVAVVGATGYAGAELVRILAGHPETELTVLTSRQFAGVRFDQVYPAIAGLVDNVCREYSTDHVCDNSDLIYMALPHKLPMAFVPDILKHGKKVIDLSADFRFNDADLYESVYQPHTARDLLDLAVCGLCEIYSDTFVPHLVPTTRGMLTTIYASPVAGLKKQDIVDCYRQAYQLQPFIRLCPEDRLPDTLHVWGTNFCDIGFRFDDKNKRLILISAIDNLE